MVESLLLRHAELVVSVHFAGDGARLVTATDHSATIWDTATGTVLYTTTKVGNHLADALLLPGDRQLFQADIAFGDSCLRDILTEQMTTTSEMIQAQCAEVAPLQRGILIASWDDRLRGAAQLLDDRTLHLRRSYTTLLEGMIMRTVVSADGKRFLALQDGFNAWTNTVGDDAVFLFELDTGLLLRRFAGPSSLHDIAFLPGEQEVAACYASDLDARGIESGVLWWQSGTGEVAGQYPCPHGPVTSLAFAPSGQLLALGCENGMVLLVGWPALDELYRFADQGQRIHRLAFSPDGRLLASASEDGTLSLRQVAT
jgi:WD40 repeat protein